MATKALEPLANITLSSAQSTVNFTSIVGTYRDLQVVVQGSLASAGNYYFKFNSDSGSNYARVNAQAQYDNTLFGGSYTSQNSISAWDPNNFEANTQFITTANVFDYSATDKHKSMLIRTSGYQINNYLNCMVVGRWANNSAITSLSVIGTQNFNSGSTFTLYGVAA